jgi:hypothetical protein
VVGAWHGLHPEEGLGATFSSKNVLCLLVVRQGFELVLVSIVCLVVLVHMWFSEL